MERLDVTEYTPGDVHVLIVRGELDIATVGALCVRLARLREGGTAPLAVLDLGGLTFCDSTGLRGLLGEARETEICGGRLRMVAPRGSRVRRLFDVCGVDQVLAVDEDRETAVSRAREASAPRQVRPAMPAAAR